MITSPNPVFLHFVGRRPVSENAPALYSLVWAQEVSPAAQRKRRPTEEHGSVHQGQAVYPAPDKWYVLICTVYRHGFVHVGWSLILSSASLTHQCVFCFPEEFDFVLDLENKESIWDQFDNRQIHVYSGLTFL